MKQYEIRTVSDFLKVPDGRLNDCIKEFKRAIKTHRELMELVGVSDFEFDCFTWLDDGKQRAIINLTTK